MPAQRFSALGLAFLWAFMLGGASALLVAAAKELSVQGQLVVALQSDRNPK